MKPPQPLVSKAAGVGIFGLTGFGEHFPDALFQSIVPGETALAEGGLAQRVGPMERQELSCDFLPVLSQKAPQGLFLGGQRGIVVVDQMEDALPQRLIKVQTGEDALGQLRAAPRVAVKVADAVFVQREAMGLSDVVEQRCPAQDGLRRDARHHRHGMLPDVLIVVRVVLLKALETLGFL